jgi:hypothetical protein
VTAEGSGLGDIEFEGASGERRIGPAGFDLILHRWRELRDEPRQLRLSGHSSP